MDIADQTLEHTAAPTAVFPVVNLSLPPGRTLMTSPVVLDARVVTGSGGGPDKTILNSPRFLGPLGYRMVCAYLYPPGDPGFEVIRRQAERYEAPLVSIPDRGPWDWRVVRDLLAVCRRDKVAVWHSHDYKTNALGLLLKRFWPMRLVTTVHGWVQHTARTPLYYKVDQLCLPRYERVICVSDDLFETCEGCGVPARNLVLLENAIDAGEYTRRRAVADAKRALGFPHPGLLVGAVGRLSAEKGFDVLIQSVHALVRRGLDVRLVIVGEGVERANLERLAADLGLGDRVTLPGWQADVRGYFEAMDVFALSSHREGLPNVLLEAMALEVPVVATRVNGVPRLVQDGRNGFLIGAGDADGLTTALLGLLTNEGLRDLFRAAGRRTVEGRYSFPTRMQKLKRIYDELLPNN
ncbi:MAG: glycosyltransferase family 1 protein [Gemmataceae bacterium]|nr:glycosyltransferase family 1 protein [Gemmataceae bacterium]